MTVQSIKKTYEGQLEIAEKYYTILLLLNNIQITKQELKILAFASLRPSISSAKSRSACQEALEISKQSLNNTIAKLQRQKVFIKDEKRVIKVNPNIKLNFQNGIKLELELLNGEEIKRTDSTEDGNTI